MPKGESKDYGYNLYGVLGRVGRTQWNNRGEDQTTGLGVRYACMPCEVALIRWVDRWEVG